MSSFIIRDTLGPAVAKSNQRLATWRRFKAAWPHDKSRYDKRLVYYDNGNLLDTVEFRKLCTIIGINYVDLEEQDYDEIEKCWFYLKQPTLEGASFSAQEMFYGMGNKANVVGDLIQIKFTYGGKLDMRLPEDDYVVVNTSEFGGDTYYAEQKHVDEVYVQSEIMSDPSKYVLSQMPRAISETRNSYMYSDGSEYDTHVAMDPKSSEILKRSNSAQYEKPIVQINCSDKYGWYAIFDDNNLTFTQVSITSPTVLGLGDGYGYEWTVTYEVIKDIEPTDECMLKYEILFNERIYQQKMNGSLPFRTTEVDFRHIYEVDDIDMWPGGQLSVPASDAMKKRDFVTMLSTIIDSDYEVEDPSIWEKVFAVVIIIVAVVVTIWSLGTMSWATIPAAAAAIGWAFAMGAIVLAIGSAILGYFGGPSANGLVKIIGNCAQYMGLISSVLGIMSFIGSFVQKMSSEAIIAAGKKAAKEASKNAATSAAGEIAYKQVMNQATELASSSFVERAFSVSTDAISSAISTAGESVVNVGKSVSSWADNLFAVYKYYDQNFGEVATLDTEIEEKQEELDKLNEENASSKLLMSGMDIYTYSLGSYDAIAELNIKMDKQSGGWTTDQDPCAAIT